MPRLLPLPIVFLSLMFALPAYAQFPDLLELSGQYVPNAELDDPDGLRVQISSYDAALNVPIVLSDTSFLIPGLAYHVDSASFADMPPGFVDLRAFHSLSVPLLFVHLFPRNWSLSARVAPGLAGDFQAFDRKMVHASGMVMATNGVSDQLVLGFGALASYAFGDLLPLPCAYLDWTPNPWFRVEAFLPAFAHVDFRVGDRFEIGPRVDIAGNEYAVRDERIRDLPVCDSDRQSADSDCLDHVAYSVGTAGLQAGVRIAHTLWATVYGGATIYRTFELRNAQDNPVQGGLQDLPMSGFFRASLIWRIPMGGGEE